MKTLLRRLVPRPIRNWARNPRRSLRWLWESAQHAVGHHPSLALAPGVTVRCHPSAYRVYRASQMHDPEQAAEFTSFLARCTPGMLLFDVGAHFGAFSLAALARGGRDARAVALDPSPAAVRIMRIQARLNGVADRMRVQRAAAGAMSGRASMLSIGVLADGYYLTPDDGRPARDLTTVPILTLDALAQSLDRVPTHIKIDTEGAEAEVLAGATALLSAKSRPLLFLELHHTIVRQHGGDPSRLLDRLEEWRYRLLGLDGVPVPRDLLLAAPLVRVVGEPI